MSIVKLQLEILRELFSEYDLALSVTLVPTVKNKPVALTRVKKAWLVPRTQERGKDCHRVLCRDLSEMHDMHYMGVERALYLTRNVDPTVSREAVKGVVKSCEHCQSVDLPLDVHEPGEVSVGESWKRRAVGVTHYRHLPYLTIVDCGPGRLAIWRELKGESAEEIA